MSEGKDLARDGVVLEASPQRRVTGLCKVMEEKGEPGCAA